MKMADRDDMDHGLDAVFAQAARPMPSDDLMARIMADAQAHVPRPLMPRPVAARRAGGWQAVLAVLGGWLPVGGLAMATVAGLAIGMVMPDALGAFASDGFATGAGAYDLSDLSPQIYQFSEQELNE